MRECEGGSREERRGERDAGRKKESEPARQTHLAKAPRHDPRPTFALAVRARRVGHLDAVADGAHERVRAELLELVRDDERGEGRAGREGRERSWPWSWSCGRRGVDVREEVLDRRRSGRAEVGVHLDVEDGREGRVGGRRG